SVGERELGRDGGECIEDDGLRCRRRRATRHPHRTGASRARQATPHPQRTGASRARQAPPPSAPSRSSARATGPPPSAGPPISAPMMQTSRHTSEWTYRGLMLLPKISNRLADGSIC
uniref:Uncharacterized protein n=1 Tax=Aegilops tauschii subsp. strangulata TaxID=200361 RepID=A0A453JRK2_AEGTS